MARAGGQQGGIGEARKAAEDDAGNRCTTGMADQNDGFGVMESLEVVDRIGDRVDHVRPVAVALAAIIGTARISPVLVEIAGPDQADGDQPAFAVAFGAAV